METFLESLELLLPKDLTSSSLSSYDCESEEDEYIFEADRRAVFMETELSREWSDEENEDTEKEDVFGTEKKALYAICSERKETEEYFDEQNPNYVALASKLLSRNLRMKNFVNPKAQTALELLQEKAAVRWGNLNQLKRRNKVLTQSHQEEYDALEMIKPKSSETSIYIGIVSKLRSLGLKMKQFSNSHNLDEKELLQYKAYRRWARLQPIKELTQRQQEDYDILKTIKIERFGKMDYVAIASELLSLGRTMKAFRKGKNLNRVEKLQWKAYQRWYRLMHLKKTKKAFTAGQIEDYEALKRIIPEQGGE